MELNKYLENINDGSIKYYSDSEIKLEQKLDEFNKGITSHQLQLYKSTPDLADLENYFASFGGTKPEFSNAVQQVFEKSEKGEFLIAFFNAKRQSDLKIPNGINKVDLKKKYGLNEKVSHQFLQYIVNLKADRSFARDSNENEVVAQIDHWFERFENRLKTIFDAEKLELRFDRKTYNFDIVIDENETFNFNQLSDGFSSILSIVTELLLRMEAHNVKGYDMEGVVLIDEIETHLHVDLQKKIFPFLIDFFPKIQFIVSTHSPFVLSSVSNATICDLETQTFITDLSAYSYDTLIESYFDTDKYSDELKTKINEYENLINIKNKTPEDRDKIKILKNYFAQAPTFHSPELSMKLQQLELKQITL